jgi:transcription antitermination factor NusG
MPIPITIEEYRAVENQTSAPSTTSTSVNETAIPAAPQEEVKKIYTTNLQVGNTVEITSGSFAGLSGVIKHLDNTKGQAGIELEMFGRITIVDIKYNELKSND